MASDETVLDHAMQKLYPELLVAGERSVFHFDSGDMSMLTTLGVVTFPAGELDACGNDFIKLVACIEKHVEKAKSE